MSDNRASGVRITEYDGRPARRDGGEWYTVKNREGSVRIEHGDFAAVASSGDAERRWARASTPADAAAPRVATAWSGVCTYRCGVERRATHVYVLKYPVPLDYLYEFDAWFQDEHMPMLLEEPTWYGCRLYRAVGASTYAFAAIHDLEPQALTSDARNRSVDTPWWHRLKQHEWFDKGFVRLLLTRL
jgi:hypothetical protein